MAHPYRLQVTLFSLVKNASPPTASPLALPLSLFSLSTDSLPPTAHPPCHHYRKTIRCHILQQTLLSIPCASCREGAVTYWGDPHNTAVKPSHSPQRYPAAASPDPSQTPPQTSTAPKGCLTPCRHRQSPYTVLSQQASK